MLCYAIEGRMINMKKMIALIFSLYFGAFTISISLPASYVEEVSVINKNSLTSSVLESNKDSKPECLPDLLDVGGPQYDCP